MNSQLPPTVFVVDDDDLSRHQLCKMLRSFGWCAAGFTSDQACRTLSPTSKADCLLINVASSTSTALQVLAALNLRGLVLPVIAITFDIDAELIMRARARSVRAVMHRPINAEKLRMAVEGVIDGRTAMADA
jgi:FixJ family two-component response regulator